MFYFDPTYFVYALPGLILGLIAQIWIKSAYGKYSQLHPGKDINGVEAAKTITENENFPVSLEVKGDALSDHFDPTKDVVSISQPSAQNASVADIAIVAHEMGHVDQKFSNSLIYGIRRILVPIVSIGSNLGYILFITGLILNLLNLAQIGLILFAGTTLFALITVPLEIDASRRGLAFVRKYNLIQEENIHGAKQVLSAAALTYIAALLTSFLQLLYFSSIFRRRS